MRPVLDTRHDILPCTVIGLRLVSDHHPRCVVLASALYLIGTRAGSMAIRCLLAGMFSSAWPVSPPGVPVGISGGGVKSILGA